MTKTLFSFGYFRKTMRRLCRIAIPGLLIMLIFSVLFPLWFGAFSGNAREPVTDLLAVQPFLYMVALLMPISFVISAFVYLRHRNASDLMDALPQTRLCRYVSGAVACFFMLVLLIVLPTLLTLLLFVLFPTGFALTAEILLRYALSAVSVGFLTTGVMTFAVSLTGTVFASIAMYTGILICPRILIYSVTAQLGYDTYIPAFFEMKFHPVYHVFVSYLGGEPALDQPGTILYGFVLGLIFFILGAVFFCRRKSELAGHPGTKPAQGIIATLLALIWLLPFAPAFADGGLGLAPDLLIIVAGVMIFCLYLLISEKSAVAMAKQLPWLGAVAALMILPAILSFILRPSLESYIPDRKDVKAVKIYLNYTVQEGTDYAPPVMDARFQDEEIIRMVIDARREYVKDDPVPGDYDPAAAPLDSTAEFLMTDGTEREMIIRMSPAQTAKLKEKMEQSTDWYVEPDPEWIEGTLYCTSLPLSVTEWKEITPALMEEKGAESPCNTARYFLKGYCRLPNGGIDEEWIPLSLTKMPKTADLVIEAVMKNTAYGAERLISDAANKDAKFPFYAVNAVSFDCVCNKGMGIDVYTDDMTDGKTGEAFRTWCAESFRAQRQSDDDIPVILTLYCLPEYYDVFADRYGNVNVYGYCPKSAVEELLACSADEDKVVFEAEYSE